MCRILLVAVGLAKNIYAVRLLVPPLKREGILWVVVANVLDREIFLSAFELQAR